jgi:hypothetical protein
VSEVQNKTKSSSDVQLPEKQTIPRDPKQGPPGRLSRDFGIHKLEKIVAGGEEKRCILQDSVKCVLHVRSKVKLHTFVNSALFCFTKGLVLRNRFSDELLDILYAVSEVWLRSIIYIVKL